MNTSDRPPLLVIAGPTASGKSGLALALGRHRTITIINADAMQVYRDLSIVTARPIPADLAAVPHALYGTVNGAVAWSAAAWATDARDAAAAATRDGRLPVLVGGSGLYLRTLLDGIAPVPVIDPAVRDAVRALRLDEVRTALEREDAGAAAALHPHDDTRQRRALEVVRATGRPLRAWQGSRTGGIAADYDVTGLILDPPRAMLDHAIAARFGSMLRDGRDEVAALVARALPPDRPVLRAIGVPEISAAINGTLTPDDAAIAGTLATRRYAKRQATWFRHQSPAAWTRAPTPDIETLLRILGR